MENFVLLLSHERLPTYSRFDLGTMANERSLPKDIDGGGFYRWYLSDQSVRNKTGRWFLTVMQLKGDLNSTDLRRGHFARYSHPLLGELWEMGTTADRKITCQWRVDLIRLSKPTPVDKILFLQTISSKIPVLPSIFFWNLHFFQFLGGYSWLIHSVFVWFSELSREYYCV